MGSSSVNNKLYTTICLSIAQLGYQFLEKYFEKCNNSPQRRRVRRGKICCRKACVFVFLPLKGKQKKVNSAFSVPQESEANGR